MRRSAGRQSVSHPLSCDRKIKREQQLERLNKNRLQSAKACALLAEHHRQFRLNQGLLVLSGSDETEHQRNTQKSEAGQADHRTETHDKLLSSEVNEEVIEGRHRVFPSGLTISNRGAQINALDTL